MTDTTTTTPAAEPKIIRIGRWVPEAIPEELRDELSAEELAAFEADAKAPTPMTIWLRPLSAEQALRVIDMINRLAPALGTVIADTNEWAERWGAEHAVVFTPDHPRYEEAVKVSGMSDDDLERAGGAVALPSSPDPSAYQAHLLARILGELKDPVIEVCALLSLRKGELSAAVANGSADELLLERTAAIRENASPEELSTLASAVVEHLRAYFSGGDHGPFGGAVLAPLMPVLAQVLAAIGMPLADEAETTVGATPESPSSTSSPAPTTGRRKSSSRSSGARRSSSSAK